VLVVPKSIPISLENLLKNFFIIIKDYKCLNILT
jgi:hypothetical protein